MPGEKKSNPGFYEYVPEESVQPPKVVVQRLEFESLPATETQFESILTTFHRLSNEVVSFRDDLDQQKAEPLITQKLGLDELAVTIHALEGGVKTDDNARAVIGQVKSYQQSNNNNNNNGMTYSLYLNQSEQSPLLELDRRVDSLCRVVGNNSNNADNSTTGGQSMFGVVRDLQARLELADEFKLDAIYRRTKALVTEIDTLETPEQTAAVQHEDQAKAQQIAQLQKVLLPLTPAAQEVPSVLSRIKTRSDTDEQAARVLLRLRRLQSLNEAATRMLLTDQQAILQVGNQMTSNSKTMTGNIQVLQQRLKALA